MVNRQLALNSDVPLRAVEISSNWTLASALSGSQFMEEWTFLRELAARSPLATDLEDLIDRSLEVQVSVGDSISGPATWVYLLHSALVSLGCEERWRQPWMSVQVEEIDASGSIDGFQENLRNLSCAGHVAEHAEWLKGFCVDRVPSAQVLWAERAQRFPGLRFLARVEGDVSDLAASGAAYVQALKALERLSADSQVWSQTEDEWPAFSTKVSPEAEQRRHLCELMDDGSGVTRCFDWHVRFTGGVPGRIHFFLDQEARRVVVGYVGRKLERALA